MTTLAEQLRERRVGLAMASGFFGFFHHAGVLAALVERGVVPRMVTGASAGALVGGLYAAGCEPDEVAGVLSSVRRSDFWDPRWPFGDPGFGFLAGERFRGLLAQHLRVHDFASCRVPLAVNGHHLATGRTHHFTSGPLIPAVHASCAVPYMFAPGEVDGERYWDGGFGEKTPLVPFLEGPEIDAVVVSYLPARHGARAPGRGARLRDFLPHPARLLAHTPYEERRERDRVSARLLRDAGIEVFVLAPPRVSLGPFSLQRGPSGVEQGRAGALELLDAADGEGLGHADLS